jgi:hypothetical protein
MRLRGAGGRCFRACRGGAAVTAKRQPDRQQAGRRRKASTPPVALPASGPGTAPSPRQAPWPRERPLAQVRPSNRLVTDPSLKTSWMARAMSGAIDSTVSLSKRFSGVMGSVLVTMTSLIREFLR